MNKRPARYVVLIDAHGNEVERVRTDRINFDAFTWLYARCEREHGKLTERLEPLGMEYSEAKRRAHVRSAIRRKSNPSVKYWKNHNVAFDDRVPLEDQQADDWEEFDPREHEECSEFNETPA